MSKYKPKCRGKLGRYVVILAGVLSIIAIARATPAGPSGVVAILGEVYGRRALLASSLEYSGPIVASAIGLAIAYRSGFITIGSEGQVLLGSAVTLWFLAYSGFSLDGYYGVVASLLLAGFAGVLLGLVPGVLRAFMGVNETLTSLMLNYVVLSFINYLVAGPWRAGAFTRTREIPEAYYMSPKGVLITLLIIAVLYEMVLRFTRLGVAVEALGVAPKAAVTYVAPATATIVLVSMLQGFSAGVGGALMMLSFQRGLKAMAESPGYGYMGILVAWLALRSPIASVVAGYFFSTLIVAGYLLQVRGVPFNVVLVIQSVIVLTLVAYLAVSREGR